MSTGPVSCLMTIQQASSLLTVPASTLRSWERRYDLPTTSRTIGGHRRYTMVAIDELRLMRDEIARGKRAADAAASARLLLQPAEPARRFIDAFLDAAQAMEPGRVRTSLDDATEELGLGPTIDEVMMPAMRRIGRWWETGRCGVGHEHLATEAVRTWLGKITAFAPEPQRLAPVVLACGPNDSHTLGVEALGALLVHAGRRCCVLGARTPVPALLATVEKTEPAAVVVVSHLSMGRRLAMDAVRTVAAPRRADVLRRQRVHLGFHPPPHSRRLPRRQPERRRARRGDGNRRVGGRSALCVQRHVAVLRVPRCPSPVPASVVTLASGGIAREDHVALLGLQRPEPAGLGRAAGRRSPGPRPAGGRGGGDVRRGRRPSARSDHLPVPARAGAGPDLAGLPHDHHPSRAARRPGPVLAGLGDPRRRARVGRHRAAGRRGDGRGTDLGQPHLPDRPGRPAPQEQPLLRAGGRRGDRARPRGPGQGGRPGVRPRTARLPPPRRARPAAADDAPVGPRVLLVRPHRDDPPADPGRRRVAGRAHHAGRSGGVGVRRPPRSGAPRPAGRRPAP